VDKLSGVRITTPTKSEVCEGSDVGKKHQYLYTTVQG